MAEMEAYFDESGTHDDSPFVCVAGYLFQKDNATALDTAWRGMLQEKGLSFFRMSDCAHGTGPFKGWPKIDRTNLESRAIDLVRTYATHGFAASVVVNDFHLIPNLGLLIARIHSHVCRCFWACSGGQMAMSFTMTLHTSLRAVHSINQKRMHSCKRSLTILR